MQPLRNTPLAEPLATERTANPTKRGCRGICSLAEVLREPGFSAGIRGVDALFHHAIEMWSSVFASQQYSMPISQLGHSRPGRPSRLRVYVRNAPKADIALT